MYKKVKDVIAAYNKNKSVLGSYSGKSKMFDEPTQDADDL